MHQDRDDDRRGLRRSARESGVLVNAVVAGVGSVYVATGSVPITGIAGVVGLLLAGLIVLKR